LAVFQGGPSRTAEKRPSLSHTGRASNAEKQPTGPGPEGRDENGPAAALLVGHVSIQICSLHPPVLGPPCRRPILIATKYLVFRGQDTSGIQVKAGTEAAESRLRFPAMSATFVVDRRKDESRLRNTRTRRCQSAAMRFLVATGLVETKRVSFSGIGDSLASYRGEPIHCNSIPSARSIVLFSPWTV
jgi:hypothetical protein